MKSKTQAIIITFLAITFSQIGSRTYSQTARPQFKELTIDQLKDKIKGAWVGQAVGVTYGGPTEFSSLNKMVPQESLVKWDEHTLKNGYLKTAYLYDDLWMDITFMNVIEKNGLNAPVDKFANAFANAPYPLWAANQNARNNILNGIMPPASGHYLNNPHADDIDFQIESDFIGIMSPGMSLASSTYCDKVGHIMAYGDGWYGGVFISALYSNAYVMNDIQSIVSQSLKLIPPQSDFHKCMTEVIQLHKQYPDDFTKTWAQLQKKWKTDKCSDGFFSFFDIDAKINSAYVLIGLLYGNGDFTKTLEISTLCGQDSDCNPSSAGGIIGTMIGFKNIPEIWKKGLNEVETMKIAYTNFSLQEVYDMSLKHALELVKQNGGSVNRKSISVPLQVPVQVKFEQTLPNHFPSHKQTILNSFEQEFSIEFEGNGFILSGGAMRRNKSDTAKYVMQVDIFLDGKLYQNVSLSTRHHDRKYDISFNFSLNPGRHFLKVIPRRNQDVLLYLSELYIYSPDNSRALYEEENTWWNNGIVDALYEPIR